MDIEIFFEGNKKVNARIKDQIVKTDQPIKQGGDGTAASPFDLFIVSMGTCVGYYIKAFCDERSIPTDNIKITQSLEWDRINHLVVNVNINISLPDEFPAKYRDAIISAANLCTVKRHLLNPPQVKVQLATNNQS